MVEAIMVANGRWMAVVVLAALLGGCGLTGVGAAKKAVFKLPREKKILVFVDVHPTVSAPGTFPTKLGENISSELYRFKAVDQVVGQLRLSEMRRDPEKFRKLGIEDVARATNADLVLYVDLITFDVGSVSDNQLTQGLAQALVKVVDRNGKRLWPVDDAVGTRVDEKVDPTFTEDQSKDAVVTKLNHMLAVDIGRFFHDYYPDAREMKQ